jgi:hypothetical protein
MNLNIDFSPQVSERLTQVALRRGIDLAKLVENIVTESLPIVDSPSTNAIVPDHFYFHASPEQFHDALAELTRMNNDLPALADAAFDRESIYEDRL